MCSVIGILFYMDPETYVLPDFMVTIHEHTGRFGVSAAMLLLSLIFFGPAYLKIQWIKPKWQKIPWHFPTLAWFIVAFFSGSDEAEDE